jgi:DNA adenine methylase Dam
LKNTYIKSPLNYVGGKYKLLQEIIPLFPDKINTFVDLFGGGFNVGINVNAEHVIYNELCSQVVELMDYLKDKPTEKLLEEIDDLVNTYDLSKENREGFLKLRDSYNSNPNPITFYTMICHAFNYQIRFNHQGKYNMPFGKDRSSFNPSLRQKFIEFCDRLHNIDCTFINISFNDFDFTDFTSNDLVYCDPPYFNSVAAYNEQDGWTIENEESLLNLLDILNENDVKFALSNNLKYNNELLDKWKDKYKVHYLNGDYSNCNYHKIDKSKDCEVLITNY